MKQLEGVLRHRLIVLVIRDDGATPIRGKNLGRLEVLACEGTLARTGRANQDHQGQFRNGNGDTLRGLEARQLLSPPLRPRTSQTLWRSHFREAVVGEGERG